MSERPVLEAIRAVLKFKAYATIAEVATFSGLPRRRVLDVINANGPFVWRIKSNGRITRVDPLTPLREQLWKSGRYYQQTTYGAWSVEGHALTFEGNDDLRKQLQETRRVGALGDSYDTSVIIDTPEHRAAIEAAGLRPWSEAGRPADRAPGRAPQGEEGMKPLPPVVGDGQTLRLTCCIPFCRRTFRNDKNGTPWPEGHEVMCGKHWRMVSKERRRRWRKLYRIYKNRKGTLQDAALAGRIVRLLNDEFERFKKIATEAAAGIG